MAAIESISEARVRMEERMNDLVLITKTIDAALTAVAQGDGPDWHHLFFGRIVQLDKAVDAYMHEVNVHAMPVLRDMRAVTR